MTLEQIAKMLAEAALGLFEGHPGLKACDVRLHGKRQVVSVGIMNPAFEGEIEVEAGDIKATIPRMLLYDGPMATVDLRFDGASA